MGRNNVGSGVCLWDPRDAKRRGYFAGNVGTSTATVSVRNTIDNLAPIVSINSPASGAVVKNTVSINGSATDNIGVTSMQIYIDGELKASSNSGAISFSWNTRKVAVGTHTIRIDAKDAFGNVGTSTIQVRR